MLIHPITRIQDISLRKLTIPHFWLHNPTFDHDTYRTVDISHLGLSENVGLIFPMIASHLYNRDSDQQNHWVQWGTQHFQTNPFAEMIHKYIYILATPTMLPTYEGCILQVRNHQLPKFYLANSKQILVLENMLPAFILTPGLKICGEKSGFV